MKKKDGKPEKIIPINRVDEQDRWIVVPGTSLEGKKRRIKEVPLIRNRCQFATGVPKSINDFIYRCVVQLRLGDHKLIFSRGVVRSRNLKVKHAVSIRELEWDVGTLITIPRVLKYREMITLNIEGIDHTLRLMELVVLHGLLQVARPGKGRDYYSAAAALVLARGFKFLDTEDFPEIYLK